MDRVREVLRAYTGDDGDDTPQGLSLKAGLNRDAVRDILRGKSHNASVTTLQSLAKAMGGDLSLFGEVPIGGQPALFDGDFTDAADAIAADTAMIRSLVEFTGHRPAHIARNINVANTTINRHYNGTATTRLSPATIERLRAAYPNYPAFAGADIAVTSLDYVLVKILPSYVGMGGGGTGEGDVEQARLPRRLIVDELRGKPDDFELIDVRGDSMEPDFQHGDQILIDRRDRDPRQPGPFALHDGDGYVVKLVERAAQRRGWYRIFSANARYSPYEVEEDAITIMGRPVWFARRL